MTVPVIELRDVRRASPAPGSDEARLAAQEDRRTQPQPEQRVTPGEQQAGQSTGGSDTLPASVPGVYRPAGLLLLAIGGLVIAVAGALLPAGWAARTRTDVALRTA